MRETARRTTCLVDYASVKDCARRKSFWTVLGSGAAVPLRDQLRIGQHSADLSPLHPFVLMATLERQANVGPIPFAPS